MSEFTPITFCDWSSTVTYKLPNVQGYFDTNKFKESLGFECSVRGQNQWGNEHECDVVILDTTDMGEREEKTKRQKIIEEWNKYWPQHFKEQEEYEKSQMEAVKKFDEDGFENKDLFDKVFDKEYLTDMLACAKDRYEDRLYWMDRGENGGPDYSMVSCYCADAKDLALILRNLVDEDFDAARKNSRGLDTCVRESIPDSVWDFLTEDLEESNA